MSCLALSSLSLIFNGYWGSVQKVMWPERAVNHSSPSSTKVKKEWSYTSVPPTCLHGVDRQNFTFTVTAPLPPLPICIDGVGRHETEDSFYFYFVKFICQGLSQHLPRLANNKCHFMLFMAFTLFIHSLCKTLKECASRQAMTTSPVMLSVWT